MLGGSVLILPTPQKSASITPEQIVNKMLYLYGASTWFQMLVFFGGKPYEKLEVYVWFWYINFWIP